MPDSFLPRHGKAVSYESDATWTFVARLGCSYEYVTHTAHFYPPAIGIELYCPPCDALQPVIGVETYGPRGRDTRPKGPYFDPDNLAEARTDG